MRKIISTALLGTALLSMAVIPALADPMVHDTMTKDAMAVEAAMSKDAMAKDTMVKADAMAKDAMMKKDAMVDSPMMIKSSGEFAKKKYKVKGQFEIVEKDGQTVLRLSDDFKTKAGPDLKIFLSPQSAQNVTGATATQGAVNIGALVANKGGSEYVIPASVDLSLFNSVLVHCEQFSVLWAAGSI